MKPDAHAAAQQLELVAAGERRRDLERMGDRVGLVKERAELEQMINEAIDKLDGRSLTRCTPDQRVEACGLVAALREVRAYVREARTRQALSTVAEAFVIDPLRQAGELHQQIERRRQHPQLDDRPALVDPPEPDGWRSRDLGGLIRALLPPALEAGPANIMSVVHHAATSEDNEQRLRAIEAYQAREIAIVERINPWGF